MQETAARPVIGVDTGGTFTDATMLDPASGRIWTAKTPSTPDDPSRGFANGVAKLLELSGFAPGDVGRVLHATTVATNLILESKGPVTGMIVNQGFKYVVEIGRQGSPRGVSPLRWIKPERLVKPQNIQEVRGRLESTGVEIEPLNEEDVRAAARYFKEQGIRSIAIVLLHSYASDAHEQRAAEIVREEYPEVLLSLSSTVVPVFREYERSMTTNLNAYVISAVASYVALIESRLQDQGIGAPLMLMKSSGGVASSATICARPVETALSGPAAGIVGAAFVGSGVNQPNLICVDIGGTSADISLISEGKASLGASGRVGNWPISLPMVEVTTIGAGGGSIASLSENGVLRVGPESAGAQPGPVCYRRGGTQPTVTDAHVVLGHLPPYLLDGSFELDVAGAREAVKAQIADPLGISVEAAAEGILAIADNAMVGTIRKLSVERGLDPRDFAMVPFGGAGPLHGGSLARLLGIRDTLLVPSPGVLSALGLLVSSLKAEFAQTCFQSSGRWELPVLKSAFERLRREALQWFDSESVPENARTIQLIANMRYEHQGFELPVPWASDSVTQESLAETVEEFHRLHRRLYTFDQRDTPVELIDIRVDATGQFERPRLVDAPASRSTDEAMTGRVDSWVDGKWENVPVYDRAKLGVGLSVAGPCIITQIDTTTWVLPGQIAKVIELGSMIISDQRV